MPKDARASDEELLEVAHVAVQVAAVRLEVEDRIADELAGTVVRDVAAAAGLEDVDAEQPLLSASSMRTCSGAGRAERDDVRVLEQEQRVAGSRPPAPGDELLLQLERLGVRDRPQPLDASGRRSGVVGEGLERLLETREESGRIGAVHEAVVVAQREERTLADGDHVRAVRLDDDGRFSMEPVPRMADVPSGMTGMPTTVPSTPGFVMENVAPWISSGLSLRSRARAARSLMRRAMPTRFSSSAFLDHRHDQAGVEVDGDADVDVAAVDDAVAGDRAVDHGELRSSRQWPRRRTPCS
jgi:hypothetical protein